MTIEGHINCDVNENAVWRPMGTEKETVWEVFLKNQSEWITNNIRNITDGNYLDTQIKTVFSHSTKKKIVDEEVPIDALWAQMNI